MARVRVENEYHEFYRTLAKDDGETSRRRTFGTMKDVFMLCFAFGVAKDQRVPLGSARDIFEADTTLMPPDWDLIKAVVLAGDESAISSIANNDGLIQTAQEYANAGVRILKREYLAAQPEESVAAALLQIFADVSHARA